VVPLIVHPHKIVSLLIRRAASLLGLQAATAAAAHALAHALALLFISPEIAALQHLEQLHALLDLLRHQPFEIIIGDSQLLANLRVRVKSPETYQPVRTENSLPHRPAASAGEFL